MVAKNKTYDVFISHRAADSGMATTLANAFRASGLEPFTVDAALAPGENLQDALWTALAESKALLVIIPKADLSPSMGVEIGAAQAWRKPIYAVVPDPSSSYLPLLYGHVKVVLPEAVEEVIQEIKQGRGTLSETERTILGEVYQEVGVPVDRLSIEHQSLEGLTDQFVSRSKKRVSSEQLLWELLRMRKQRHLPRLALRTGVRPRRHPA